MEISEKLAFSTCYLRLLTWECSEKPAFSTCYLNLFARKRSENLAFSTCYLNLLTWKCSEKPAFSTCYLNLFARKRSENLVFSTCYLNPPVKKRTIYRFHFQSELFIVVFPPKQIVYFHSKANWHCLSSFSLQSELFIDISSSKRIVYRYFLFKASCLSLLTPKSRYSPRKFKIEKANYSAIFPNTECSCGKQIIYSTLHEHVRKRIVSRKPLGIPWELPWGPRRNPLNSKTRNSYPKKRIQLSGYLSQKANYLSAFIPKPNYSIPRPKNVNQLPIWRAIYRNASPESQFNSGQFISGFHASIMISTPSPCPFLWQIWSWITLSLWGGIMVSIDMTLMGVQSRTPLHSNVTGISARGTLAEVPVAQVPIASYRTWGQSSSVSQSDQSSCSDDDPAIGHLAFLIWFVFSSSF